ncbi:MAG: 3-deoxy-manno-octulosonate cytidylyltransferase [Flavobacteriales bacterium]|nr:3-deoxy-manno-octulosonate cytidylyltransferase [Flavobacteriales bacterium]
MKVIGIIPARYASSRFLGKPLVVIRGKSMIQRVYEQARLSKLDEVWVATDDARIYDEIKKCGGNVIMTEEDIPNGSARCRAAFKEIGKGAEAFINIQGDEPFIHPDSINTLISLLRNGNVSIATLIQEEKDEDDIVDPNRVKVVIDKAGKALLFSRSVIPFPRTKPEGLKRYVHLGIYGFKAEILDQLEQLKTSPEEESEQLEQLTWLVNGYDIHTAISPFPSFSIDTQSDLDYVESNWDNIAI